MIIKIFLLVAEKIITSGTRFALIFYVLGSLEKTSANVFFHLTSAITLLLTICHLGTDTLIIGKEIEKKDTSQIFFIRFISLIISIILLFYIFEFNMSSKTYILITLALVGASQPIKQLQALSVPDNQKILANRVAPEITCGILRIIGMATGVINTDILIILFFAPEIIYGVLNTSTILIKIKYKKFISIRLEKNINYAILWSSISMVSLFGLQRGDVLLLTSGNASLGQDVEKIIKYQQFFDVSGLLTTAAIPLIRGFITKKESPAGMIMIIGLFGAIFSLATLMILEKNKFLSNAILYIRGDLPIYQISIIFGLGLITYNSITYFGLLAQQKLITLILSACLVFKVLCFLLFLHSENIALYSFTSATFFASALILAIALYTSRTVNNLL